MRARTIILLFVAIMFAGGAYFFARSYLATERTRTIQEANPVALTKPSKSVLVAHNDIKRGQILRPEDTSWQIWPEGALDKNYIVLNGPPLPARTPESYAGWVAENPITQGEPITEARIIAPGNRGFLAAVLRPGMRALSVPVTVTSGVAGFIFPGDQVDVMLTFTVPASVFATGAAGTAAVEHKAVETVLRDIRVIAIDQRLQSKPGEAVPAHTATFEVTSKESEVIALASKIGELSLALRSLAPEPEKPLAAGQAVPVTTNQNGPDSPIAATATCTLDSEVSPLLPKVLSKEGACEAAAVSILRGSEKGSQSSAPPAAGKGS
ncbi:MAG: Flp pilus assembly protein CpaB [Stellaceae bacterium]